MLTCWTIWKERNRRVFQKKEETMTRLFSLLQDEAKDWIVAGAKDLALLGVLSITE